MSSSDYDNDELVFLEEDTAKAEEPNRGYWNVLVVDDDEEIHSVTRLALSDLTISNRGLNFLHAYSAKEALEVIKEYGRNIAIILLDVVMETDDAGLQLAKTLRNDLGLDEPRIILRTGQPGYAPEESVIKTYDINDYKTKTELTRNKLVTTMIASLRSYQQILTINQSRLGLEKIITSSANLLEEHSVKGFCEGVVTQITSLIGLDAEGVVCARAGSVLDKDDDGVYVLGAAGGFAEFINQRLEHIDDEKIVHFVSQCLKQKEHIYGHDFTVLYLNSSGYEASVFVRASEEIRGVHKQLIEVFLSSISIGYENVNLFHQLRTAAFRDWLTKLPNRNEFINMLDRLDASDAYVESINVVLVDVNHFSDINDGLGQEAGNELLKAIAKRIQSTFDETKIGMGRIAADVFGLFGPASIINPDALSALFVAPFKAGDHTIPVNVTMGASELKGEECCSGINILKQTNIALNLAKKSVTNNYAFYSADMEERTTWRLGMIRQLRTDFADKKLQIWYQPQVDLLNERIVGLEALLRWPSKDGGYISPAVFVPLAEYSGLIIDIGAWVLDQACIDLKKLQARGNNDLRMAVNISMPQFRDPQFVKLVIDTVNQHQVEAKSVELEITESVVMDEPQIVIDSLQELKRHGIMIAIDDFGTGFSSLNYLKQLPLDRLKVDRSFVNEVGQGESAFIAETIVTLGNKLGLQTIAEGVERREQASYMLKLGCDEAQGFLYAKPMPFDELTTFIDNYEQAF